MSLSQKNVLRNVGLLAGFFLIGAASLWGLNGLRRNVNDALEAYADLKAVETVTPLIATARARVEAPDPQPIQAAAILRPAVRELDGFVANLAGPAAAGDSYSIQAKAIAETSTAKVRSALAQLEAGESQPPAATLAAVADDLKRLNRMCMEFVHTTQEAASTRVRQTLLIIGALVGVVFAGAVLVTFAQHRAIVRPLEALRQSVRRVAAKKFTERVPVTGDRELAELAVEFNHMAEELDGFYHHLEEKVATKSKELVRSERLASLGFLAAGVAHEINNPLNVISGYAELLLNRLDREHPAGSPTAADPLEPAMVADARESLAIIRDEAFRGKEITAKLLSLARSSDKRELISLAQICNEVASLMSGLKNYRDRRLVLRFDEEDLLNVRANSTELKQVLLNLTVNAFEATSPGDGEVCVSARRHGGWIELSVRDNGRGMTPQVLERVFEPFFTEKRGIGVPGTGLGLSITHAIVEGHGGHIRAESDGPGRGSRFIVTLPPAHETLRPEEAMA